jgi:NAD(P)H-hydrate epimerase
MADMAIGIDDAGRWGELDARQMREVDRIMTEDLGVDLLQMMENAGSHLAQVALVCFRPRTVLVLAGTGGNGGGGLVAARHLANRGVVVTAVLTGEPAPGSVPARQLAIARRVGVTIADLPPEESELDLVLDAMIGYSLRGAPTGRAAELIAWTRESPVPVLCLDLPSGLDASTGRVHDACVRAAATVTLALPKTGLAAAQEVVGMLYVADIGVPPSVYPRVGVPAPEGLFHEQTLVRLRHAPSRSSRA